MKNLQKALKDKNNFLKKFIPSPLMRYMDRVTDNLRINGYQTKPLKVGDKIPDERLINYLGQSILFSNLLNNKAAIISFYRGAWCPYCNLELAYYDQILKEEKNKNILMFAISPEKPDVTMKSIEIEKLNFNVLSDVNNQLAKKLKLVFELPLTLKRIYRVMGINLKKSQGNVEEKLPIPATYVVDNNGIITHAWIDVDYTKRAEPSEVIDAYKGIA